MITRCRNNLPANGDLPHLMDDKEVSLSQTETRGGDFHLKGAGILVEKFEFNPLRRPIWAWLKIYFFVDFPDQKNV